MVSELVEWVEVEKNVYNVETDETEGMKFLRLNQINKYNHQMGVVLILLINLEASIGAIAL